MTSDEEKLRYWLWLLHAPSHLASLYGDDGEMQCPACSIDFRRDPVKKIDAIFKGREHDGMCKYFQEKKIINTDGAGI